MKNDGRLLSYKNINKDVKNLLRDFGLSRKSYRPEFPFWRLRNDGVWEVTNTDGIVVNKSGDVRKTELIMRNARGGFTKEIYNAATHIRRDTYATDVAREAIPR